MDEARRKKLESICKAVNSGEFAGEHKDAVQFVGSRDVIKLTRWSSGCPDLDEALGGGWPRGRFIELYGPESSGKTTLTLHAIAEYQKKWPEEEVAFIDTEFAFDEEYAVALGVNVGCLIVHQPDNAEQALNVLKQLVQLGVKLFVVDSVAALSSKVEQAGDLGDQTVGLQARLMSSSLRQLAGICGRADATVLWTNQLREKIGVTYGDKTTTPAGRALKHYASVRTAIARIGSEKEMINGEKINVCNHVKVDVKKNKCVASGEILYIPHRGCVTIDDLCGEKNFPVMSFDGQHFHESEAEGCYKQKVEPCVEVKVRAVGSSFVNLDHPFLTPTGYVRAEDLEHGDLIACADCLPSVVDDDSVWNTDRATLAGLLTGDGWVGGTTGVALRNFSSGCVERFRDAVDEFGCSIYEKDDQDGLWVIRGNGKGAENSLYTFLKEIEMWGKRAWEKEVPSSLFNAAPSCRWAFIGGLLAADGWVTDKTVGLQVTSKLLAEGVRNLLLLSGVRSSVSRRSPRKGGKVDGRRIVGKRMSYVVRVRHRDGIQRIVDNVPWADGKLDGEIAYSKSICSRVPIEWADRVIKKASAKGLTPKWFLEKRGFGRPRGGWSMALGMKRRTGTANRERVLQLSLDVEDNEIYDLCMSSIEWHPVSGVIAAGDMLTYDIAGTGWENFLLNGMVTHNTAPPFRRAKFYITFGFGIDMVAAYLDGALKAGVVKKKGGWHSIGDQKIGNGRLNVLTELRENEELLEDIKSAVQTGEIPAKYTEDAKPTKATQSKAQKRKKAKAKTEPEEDPLEDMDEEAIDREPVTQEKLDSMGIKVDVEDV